MPGNNCHTATLLQACETGNEAIARLLLDPAIIGEAHRAHADALGSLALIMTARAGNGVMCEMLLKTLPSLAPLGQGGWAQALLAGNSAGAEAMGLAPHAQGPVTGCRRAGMIWA